jgi:hypothetical protein
MHYHSTCYGCLTPTELQGYIDSQGESQTPGGTAFTTEELARSDADSENKASYMIGWTGHRQVVAPCMGMHCRPYTSSHKVEWQRQGAQR